LIDFPITTVFQPSSTFAFFLLMTYQMHLQRNLIHCYLFCRIGELEQSRNRSINRLDTITGIENRRTRRSGFFCKCTNRIKSEAQMKISGYKPESV